MTWKQLHSQNRKLIKSYMDFLCDETTVLDYDSRLKLITEIGRLELQKQQIEAMTVEDYYQEIYEYEIQLSA